jgi:hypothetical protein
VTSKELRDRVLNEAIKHSRFDTNVADRVLSTMIEAMFDILDRLEKLEQTKSQKD